ncbi:MAG TPA: carboxymuconolactone decarboxylase family protein [Phenylobacterium sp.]|jgi:alkylhydroperoxidase family enzyme
MPRIAPLSPPYAPDVQSSFDAVMPPGYPPLALFRTVATSARAWRKFRAGSLLDKGPLCLRHREIVIDRTCALNGCAYEWGVHVALLADAADLTPSEIAALAAADPGAGAWSPGEAALIAAIDALHARAALTDAEWARLRAHFDDAQILEAILLCGFYRTVAYLANGLDLPLEPYGAPLPAGAVAQSNTTRGK